MNYPLDKTLVDNVCGAFGLMDAHELGNATIRQLVAIVRAIEQQADCEYVHMELGNPGLPAEQIGVEAQIKALQTERSWKQWDLLQEWEAEIKAYAEESVRERKEKLKDNSLENLQKIRDEALKKHAEVQARNAESMQKAVNQSLERQKNRERLLTVAKRISLENKIDMDLTEKAMRLAYKYRIDVILTTPTKDLNTILNRNRLDFIDEKTYPVVAVDAIDLTNELTDEISRSSLE